MRRVFSAEERIRRQQRKHHKILVLVTADPKTAMVIRRARRVSDFLGADCFAVAVQDSRGVSTSGPNTNASRSRSILTSLDTCILRRGYWRAADTASVVLDFARRNGVTQIFVTRPTDPFGVCSLARILFSESSPRRKTCRS